MTKTITVQQERKLPYANIAAYVLAALFFAWLFLIVMRLPFQDPDFWWHLKTGEYVLEHGKVPQEDPFAFTTPSPLNETKKIGLRAHWLGQVLLYLPYKAAGLGGVAVLRSFLVILPMLILFLWLLRRGLNPFFALAVTGFPGLMFAAKLPYTFERPQGFSFTLALLLIMLMERLREKTSESKTPSMDRSFWLVPSLMVLWANIHGGYIIGNVTIMIYIFAEALRNGYARLRGRSGLHPAFFIVCLIALGVSFVNPNTYHIFYDYLRGHAAFFFKSLASGGGGGGGWVGTTVKEYRSLIFFYNAGDTDLLFFWTFQGILYFVLFVKYVLKRKFDITEFLIVGFFVFFSNYYSRGMMFALAALPFFLGRSLNELRQPGPWFRRSRSAAVVAVLVLTVGFFAFTYRKIPDSYKPGIASTWVSPVYPQGVVDFIKKEHIEGPMYNYYDWGGFLIWSLYPDYRVFCDGRALDNKVSRTADSILRARDGWSRSLDEYKVNFIVIPLVNPEFGYVIDLAKALVYEYGWELVYLSGNDALFVRKEPRNREVIDRYRKDRKDIFRQIIAMEDTFINSYRRQFYHFLYKADALLALGRYEEAKAIYRRFPRQAAPMLRMLE